MQIILASGSETRAEMFRAAGINVEIVPPRIDESEVKISLRAEGHSPRDQADALAEMKALRISARHPDALVIGGDQVLDLEGQAFDKPENMAEARSISENFAAQGMIFIVPVSLPKAAAQSGGILAGRG